MSLLMTVAACGVAAGDAGGTLHGPVITPAKTWHESPTAEVIGKLELDSGCLVLGGAVVFWPKGTTWDAEERSVELTDGTRARVGGRFHGGGGDYDPDTDFADLLDSSEAATRIADCLDPTGADGVAILTP